MCGDSETHSSLPAVIKMEPTASLLKNVYQQADKKVGDAELLCM